MGTELVQHFACRWPSTRPSASTVLNIKWGMFTSKWLWLLWTLISFRWPGPWFNIKMASYQYRKSHCGDKTVVRSSYLHNGISYTGKMSSLYWTSPQMMSSTMGDGISGNLVTLCVLKWETNWLHYTVVIQHHGIIQHLLETQRSDENMERCLDKNLN